MITPATEILNQKGTPMFNSDLFANRPAAGIAGRIFISTDTKELYRDTGTTWELLSAGGGGTVTGTGSATQVAFWTGSSAIGGNNDLWWDNVNDYLGIKTNSPISELDVVGQGYFHPSVTAAANAGWASSYAFTTATIPATTFSNLGNVFCGATGINSMLYNGDATFQQANVPAAVIGNNIFRFGSSGLTISLNQGSGLRAFSALTAFNQVQSNFVGAISHLAGVHILSPYASNQLMNVTNYYGLLINNATERAAFTITNRWGVYQDGALDRNYFAGNVLIKSNVDNGSALQVTGASTFSGKITANASISGDVIANIVNTSATGFGLRTQGGGGNSGLYLLAVNDYAGTNRLLVDGIGNVGISVTPSAWLSSQRALEVSGWSINAASVTSTLATNAFVNDSSQWIYKSNGFATRYDNVSGQHQWFTAPSGTAGNPITFTQAMTLDASGNLGIGTPSPQGTLDVYQASGSVLFVRSVNSTLRFVSVGSTNFIQSGLDTSTGSSAPLVFSNMNGNNEFMRISSVGNLLIGSPTDTGNKLYLNGSLRIDGQRSGTAGGASGQHLIITLDGIQYKIALLNP